MSTQTSAPQNALTFATHYDVGGRANLEDRVAARHIHTAAGLPLTVAMVADGIGGHNSGEIAAQLAVETVFEELETAELSDPQHLPLQLQYALQRANEVVYREAVADRSKQGMGTTSTVIAIHEQKLYLAHVGDSRAYLVRDGRAIQITQDHTWEQEMVKRGILSAEEARQHPKKEELVYSIGYDPQTHVDLGLYSNGGESEETARHHQGLPLQKNDRLVLCSDGLVKERRNGSEPYVTDPEIAQIVVQNIPDKAAKELVRRAVSRQADDNVSAVVLEMPGSKRQSTLLPNLAKGILGLFIVIGLVGLGMTFLPDLLATGAATSAPTLPATEAGALTLAEESPEAASTPTPAEPIPITVDAGSAGLNWKSGETEGTVTGTDSLNFTAGHPLHLENGNDVSDLTLSTNNTRLFLDVGSTIVLEEITVNNTLLEIVNGKLLIVADSNSVVIRNLLDGRITLETGMLAVTYAETPFEFQVDCMAGTCFINTRQLGQKPVPPKQSLCDGSGCAASGEETALRYEAFTHLSNLVPTPTSTPTQTLTPTSTPTRARPSTSTPTATATPAGSDSDGDTVLDSEDNCVAEPGLPENNGCPAPGGDGDSGDNNNDGNISDEPGQTAPSDDLFP